MLCPPTLMKSKSACRSQCDSFPHSFEGNLCYVLHPFFSATLSAISLTLTCIHVNGLCLFSPALGYSLFVHLSKLKPPTKGFWCNCSLLLHPTSCLLWFISFLLSWLHLILLQAVHSTRFQVVPTSRAWLEKESACHSNGTNVLSADGANSSSHGLWQGGGSLRIFCLFGWLF